MHPPSTVFDRPQWHLLPDPKGERNYANVSNILEIVRGRYFLRAPVVVNAELFTLMREVFKVPVESACSLSMDLVGQFYVFSLYAGETVGWGPNLYDLWSYPASSPPGWLLQRQFHL